MFSKTSIQCSVYDMIDVFMFPNEDIQKIYESYEIQKFFLFQNLTDQTVHLYFSFLFVISYVQLMKKKSRDIIFEVLIKSKLLERLDLSKIFGKDLMFKTKN